MQKNLNARAIGLTILAAGFATASLVNYVVEKRDNKKRAAEACDRKIAFTHYVDQLDGLNAELDRKIAIAKKALEDDDFNEITRNYED